MSEQFFQDWWQKINYISITSLITLIFYNLGPEGRGAEGGGGGVLTHPLTAVGTFYYLLGIRDGRNTAQVKPSTVDLVTPVC